MEMVASLSPVVPGRAQEGMPGVVNFGCCYSSVLGFLTLSCISVFLPPRSPPLDRAFNGDLAQPAGSEPPTDVSYPPL